MALLPEKILFKFDSWNRVYASYYFTIIYSLPTTTTTSTKITTSTYVSVQATDSADAAYQFSTLSVAVATTPDDALSPTLTSGTTIPLAATTSNFPSAEPTDSGETLPNISISTKYATDSDGPPESTITLEVSSGQSIIPSVVTGVISVSSVSTGSVATAASKTGAAHCPGTSQVLVTVALFLVLAQL